MKRLILACSILFVFLSALAIAEPNEIQQKFAESLVENNSAVLRAVWGTSLGLEVYVDLNSLGANPKMQAQLAADDIVNQGFKYTDKPICAIIYYGNGHKLASSCRFE